MGTLWLVRPSVLPSATHAQCPDPLQARLTRWIRWAQTTYWGVAFDNAVLKPSWSPRISWSDPPITGRMRRNTYHVIILSSASVPRFPLNIIIQLQNLPPGSVATAKIMYNHSRMDRDSVEVHVINLSPSLPLSLSFSLFRGTIRRVLVERKSREIHERFETMIQEPLSMDLGTTHEWSRNHSRVIQEPLTSDSGTTHEWSRNYLSRVIQEPGDSGTTHEWFRNYSRGIRNHSRVIQEPLTSDPGTYSRVIQEPLTSDSGTTHEWFGNHSRVIQEPLTSDSGTTLIQELTRDSGTTHEWFTNLSRVINLSTSDSRTTHEWFRNLSRDSGTTHEWSGNLSRVIQEPLTSDSGTTHSDYGPLIIRKPSFECIQRSALKLYSIFLQLLPSGRMYCSCPYKDHADDTKWFSHS